MPPPPADNRKRVVGARRGGDRTEGLLRYFECVTFKDIAEETIIQAQSGALSAFVLVITAVVVRG